MAEFCKLSIFGTVFEVTTRYVDLQPVGMGAFGLVCSAKDEVSSSPRLAPIPSFPTRQLVPPTFTGVHLRPTSDYRMPPSAAHWHLSRNQEDVRAPSLDPSSPSLVPAR